ncbi:uncharacterized protein F5891DRAFT_1187211 [Suillus fuscotomentosus]|uniref:Uncharacterized protein n=1 Tax=Suillus fuscotomentosus TaxID=1912939 RepID=A0AAD4EB73_9AGAM|nr:uncharacterized protein F5891DRAFT_1187211 [Suillus fuscotomentosus]KAG1865704.1 hypothetical protein C8R48DRAFT_772699 [Suillus tomentosus]KAG1901743.1 hypothetical protein F5891DRAFT_1187211 [Suillus fuscotomentosus]
MSARPPNQPSLPRIKLELSEDALKAINARLLELDVVKNTQAIHFSPMFSIYATTVLLAAIITACPDLLDQRYARVEEAMQALCENLRLQEDLREAIEKQDFTDVLNIEMLQKPARANIRLLNRRRTL